MLIKSSQLFFFFVSRPFFFFLIGGSYTVQVVIFIVCDIGVTSGGSNSGDIPRILLGQVSTTASLV